MSKLVVGIFLLFVFFPAVFGYLYFFGGLRQYFAMIKVVNNLPAEEKEQMYTELTGMNKRGGEYGVLAGIGFGRVWVWQIGQMRQLKYDQDTVYSFFEGCREDVRARLNRGEKNVIQQEVSTDKNDWLTKAKTGDYVTFYLSNPENGGKTGNLREIYAYNFWLFLKRGIDTQCAK